MECVYRGGFGIFQKRPSQRVPWKLKHKVKLCTIFNVFLYKISDLMTIGAEL